MSEAIEPKYVFHDQKTVTRFDPFQRQVLPLSFVLIWFSPPLLLGIAVCKLLKI